MPKMNAIAQNARTLAYATAAAQTYLDGAAVLENGSGAVEECGADPTTILGFAKGPAATDPLPTLSLVAVAEADSEFWLSGTADPVIGDIDTEYGIVKDSDGIWIVDKSDTTNTRVVVKQVDLVRNMFLINVLTANRQLD